MGRSVDAFIEGTKNHDNGTKWMVGKQATKWGRRWDRTKPCLPYVAAFVVLITLAGVVLAAGGGMLASGLYFHMQNFTLMGGIIMGAGGVWALVESVGYLVFILFLLLGGITESCVQEK